MSSAAGEQVLRPGRRPRRQPPTLWARVVASPWTYRLLTLAVFGCLWEVFAGYADSMLIPLFSGTVEGMFQLVRTPEIWNAFLISNEAFVIGFAVSLVGIPIGFAMARFSIVDRASAPYMSILLVTPTAALIPILIIAFGLGLVSRVIIVVLFTVPYVIVNSAAGVRKVDTSLLEMARSFGASERKIWWRILLPGAMPGVMTGIRIGVGRAIEGMVIVELLMISVGIGYQIQQFTAMFESELLYAIVALVVVEALVVVNAVRWLERRLGRWSHDTRLAD
ncbi:ABC transporter permease [Actinophytocola sp.]|uniref:ABC transporter permease n=1 Tax=Actinophytocola sp. TaxID=1872138 RepID=UPI003D6A312E